MGKTQSRSEPKSVRFMAPAKSAYTSACDARPRFRSRGERPRGFAARTSPKLQTFDLDHFFDPRRYVLVCASAYATGIALYFSLPREPWLVYLLAVLVTLIAWRRRLSLFGYQRQGLWILICLVLGLVVGTVHTSLRSPVFPSGTLEQVRLEGWVKRVEVRNTGAHRLTIYLGEPLEGLPADAHQVRVTTRTKTIPDEGDYVRTRATLMEPPSPVLPGAYDMAPSLHYAQLSAIGYTTGRVYPAREPHSAPFLLRIETHWRALRSRYADRLYALGEQSEGAALGAALIAGERGFLSPEDREALRGAGLAHIISISGLHMVMISGLVFWLCRILLAAVPGLALRYDVKPLAALGGMAGAALYLMVSGASLPAIRAFVMVMIAFGAILAGTWALSLRNIAIAAIVILSFAPHELMKPGFQMSFAATVALIAYFESRRFADAQEPRLTKHPHAFWFIALLTKLRLYFSTIAITTLIASGATLPIAAFHFNVVTSVGLLGNFLVLPLLGFFVMPLAVMTLFLAPLGLDGFAFSLMAIGCEAILNMARFVSALPGAQVFWPRFSGAALMLLFLAMMLAICFRGKWKLSALLFVVPAVVLMGMPMRFDALVSPSGKSVMVREANGQLAATYVGSGERFLRGTWLRIDGDRRHWPEVDDEVRKSCGEGLCVVGRVVHVKEEQAAEAACEEAVRIRGVIVAPFALSCPKAEMVLTPETMREGSVGLKQSAEGFSRYDAERGSRRPWNAYRLSR